MYPYYMDLSRWHFATNEELRSTTWAAECPLFQRGTRPLKMGIADDLMPFQYQSVDLKHPLLKSGISKTREFDSTHIARRKIIQSRKNFY